MNLIVIIVLIFTVSQNRVILAEDQKLSPPVQVDASDGKSDNSVSIKWECVDGADYYEVYRSPTADPNDAILLWERSTPLWDYCFYNDFISIDNQICQHKKYYYWIKSCSDQDGISKSDFSQPDEGWINLNITPQSSHFSYAGGNDAIDVDFDYCMLNATSNASWIRIESDPSDAGKRTLYYSVFENPYSYTRTGNIVIAENIILITQEGRPDPIAQKDLPIFETQDLSMIIHDDNPNGITSTINVTSNLPISKLLIRLNIIHDFTNDLKGILVSPAGKQINLFESLTAAINMDVIFDDSAEMIITEATPPFQGAFKPVEPLSLFYGDSSYGEWKLIIIDYAEENTGSLESWRLNFLSLPPTANAGFNQVVKSGDVVHLDASKSFDPDDGIIHYQWIIENGEGIALSDSNAISPVFNAPETDLKEIHLKIKLLVTDVSGNMDIHHCNIRVVPKNYEVFSNHETNLEIPQDETGGNSIRSKIIIDRPGQYVKDVNLVLDITHPRVNDLFAKLIGPGPSYEIVIPFYFTPVHASNFHHMILDDDAKISLNDSRHPIIGKYRPLAPLHVFNGEPLTGEWLLIVNDYSENDSVGVLNSWNLEIVSEAGIPPVAKTKHDIFFSKGKKGLLDAKDSYDNDNDIVLFDWVQILGPSVILSEPNSDNPVFTAPNFNTCLKFLVNVTDNTGLKSNDFCIVKIGYKRLRNTDEIDLSSTGKHQSVLNIENEGFVKDVNVFLSFNMDTYADIKFNLISPNGTSIRLLRLDNIYVYGRSVEFIRTIFDDEAENSFFHGSPPYSDAFLPEESLKAFQGESISGEWKLEIIDDYDDVNEARFDSWTIEILSSLTGDYNHDNAVNIGDIIFGLKQLSGINDVQIDFFKNDVNADDTFGLQDLIFLLKKIASEALE